MVPAAARVAPGIVYHCQAGTSNIPPGQAQAQTYIHIFAVHKVPLVKTTHGSERRRPKHHAGTIYPICLPHRERHSPGGFATPSPPCAVNQSPGGEQLACKILPLPSWINLFRAQQAELGLPTSCTQTPPERRTIGWPNYVGVDHRKPGCICTRTRKRLVVVGTKTQGRRVTDNLQFEWPLICMQFTLNGGLGQIQRQQHPHRQPRARQRLCQ